MSTSWIVPCNIKYFDIIGLFKRQKLVCYKQSTNVEAGDVVFIYIGQPYSEIKYRCRVLETNMPVCYIDDDAFVINGKVYLDYGRFMTLLLEEEYMNGQMTLHALHELGIKGSIQSPMKISPSLQERILNDLIFKTQI